MDQQADPPAHQPLRPRPAVARGVTGLDGKRPARRGTGPATLSGILPSWPAETKENAALWHELADAGSAYHDNSR